MASVTSRRRAREMAIRALYQLDIVKNDPDDAVRSVLDVSQSEWPTERLEEGAEFIRELVNGAWSHRDQIDQLIRDHSIKWDPERLGKVEKAILRLASYELVYRDDIPKAASINEAVELAKSYGSEDLSRFVNGVLAGVVRATNSPTP